MTSAESVDLLQEKLATLHKQRVSLVLDSANRDDREPRRSVLETDIRCITSLLIRWFRIKLFSLDERSDEYLDTTRALMILLYDMIDLESSHEGYWKQQIDRLHDKLSLSPPSSARTSGQSKAPNPLRKSRWIEINSILEPVNKKSRNESTAYTNVSWSDIEPPGNENTQERTRGNDAARLHFIAPILVCVCSQFDDFEISAEADLVGELLKARAHFEFIIRRGDKAICIVEAKKDDIQQGLAQDLVGCEVLAEKNGLNTVYGIVTNYINWTFIRSLDDRIEEDARSLRLADFGPDRDSLREITAKIYSLLSDP